MNNLRLYHKLLSQFCQWFPEEQITRKRNLAWLVVQGFLKVAKMGDKKTFLGYACLNPQTKTEEGHHEVYHGSRTGV